MLYKLNYKLYLGFVGREVNLWTWALCSICGVLKTSLSAKNNRLRISSVAALHVLYFWFLVQLKSLPWLLFQVSFTQMLRWAQCKAAMEAKAWPHRSQLVTMHLSTHLSLIRISASHLIEKRCSNVVRFCMIAIDFVFHLYSILQRNLVTSKLCLT